MISNSGLKTIYRMFLFFTFIILSTYSIDENIIGETEGLIRVWHSGLNNGEHYGHVSLQTRNAHVSLWPSNRNRKDLPNVGCLIATAQNNATYADDVADEEREADAIYKIKIPNVLALEREWRRLNNGEPLTWFAIGTHITRQNALDQLENLDRDIREQINRLTPGKVFNCASIVDYLLKVGGTNLENYLDIASIHNPIMQGLLISGIANSQNTRVDIIDVIKVTSVLTYPDKIGYMAKRAMIAQVSKDHDCELSPLDYYLNSLEITEEWYGLITTYSGRNLRTKLQEIKKRRDDQYIFKDCILL